MKRPGWPVSAIWQEFKKKRHKDQEKTRFSAVECRILPTDLSSGVCPPLCPYLYYLPGHVKDTPGSLAQVIAQPFGGPSPDHSARQDGFSVSQPPLLPALLALASLELPLFLMVAEPQQAFLLRQSKPDGGTTGSCKAISGAQAQASSPKSETRQMHDHTGHSWSWNSCSSQG